MAQPSPPNDHQPSRQELQAGGDASGWQERRMIRGKWQDPGGREERTARRPDDLGPPHRGELRRTRCPDPDRRSRLQPKPRLADRCPADRRLSRGGRRDGRGAADNQPAARRRGDEHQPDRAFGQPNARPGLSEVHGAAGRTRADPDRDPPARCSGSSTLARDARTGSKRLKVAGAEPDGAGASE